MPTVTALQDGHPRQLSLGENSYLTTHHLPGSPPVLSNAWQSMRIGVEWLQPGHRGGGELLPNSHNFSYISQNEM